MKTGLLLFARAGVGVGGGGKLAGRRMVWFPEDSSVICSNGAGEGGGVWRGERGSGSQKIAM